MLKGNFGIFRDGLNFPMVLCQTETNIFEIGPRLRKTAAASSSETDCNEISVANGAWVNFWPPKVLGFD